MSSERKENAMAPTGCCKISMHENFARSVESTEPLLLIDLQTTKTLEKDIVVCLGLKMTGGRDNIDIL